MPRSIAFLIALGALLGLLSQGFASAREGPTMFAMQDCKHIAAAHHGSIPHQNAAAHPTQGCKDCPMTGDDGKPCNDINRCLAVSGAALVLPDILPLATLHTMIAQRYLTLRAPELSGVVAPPFTEPPILPA